MYYENAETGDWIRITHNEKRDGIIITCFDNHDKESTSIRFSKPLAKRLAKLISQYPRGIGEHELEENGKTRIVSKKHFGLVISSKKHSISLDDYLASFLSKNIFKYI